MPPQWVIQPGIVRPTTCEKPSCKTCRPRVAEQDNSPGHKPGEPPYCDVCQEVFYDRQEVERHVRRSHEVNAAGIRATLVRVNGVNKVFCRWPGCRERFLAPWTTSIARHIVDVHIVAPVHCDMCGSWMAGKSALTYHQRETCKQRGDSDSKKRARSEDGNDEEPAAKKQNAVPGPSRAGPRTRRSSKVLAASA